MSGTATIPRVELAWSVAELPPYRPGHWVRAGTPTTEPYPCTCRYSPCSYPKCPDRYRTEGDALPGGCCGRRGEAPPIHGDSLERPSGYSRGDRGSPGARKASGSTLTSGGGRDARTSWERRLPTAPGAAVADSELWATALDDAPPAWDALDEVSPVHGDGPEGAAGYSHTPRGSEAEEDEAEKRWHAELGRRQAAVVAGHCDCPTPWDADGPTLILARTKDGPIETSWPLPDRPGIDVRAESERLLREHPLGLYPLKAWKDGRHVLLPPADPNGRVRTRPGWAAPVADGAWAVIDVPDAPRSGGVHCPDCHRSFGNAGAWQLHRPRSTRGCVDPASIRLVRRVMLASNASTSGQTGPSGSRSIDRVEYGPPLLKRTLAGVWSIDPLAVWPDGPTMSPEQALAVWKRGQDQLAASRWQFGRGHNRAA